jgi:hypothetical protein
MNPAESLLDGEKEEGERGGGVVSKETSEKVPYPLP